MDLAAVFFKKDEESYFWLTKHNNFDVLDLLSPKLLLNIIIPKSEEEIIGEDFSIVFSKKRSLFSSSFSIQCPPKKSFLGSKSPVVKYERTENLHFTRDDKKYYYTRQL